MSLGRLIITGVSSGIGKALAEEALAAGWEVDGIGRNSCEAIDRHENGTFFVVPLLHTP